MMKNKLNQRQNQLISLIVSAVTTVFIYACTNDFTQCMPLAPTQNIIGKWNYKSDFLKAHDPTEPSNFTGIITFDKEGNIDDPYHFLPGRFSGTLVERKLYRFDKDTIHIALTNKTDTLYATNALLYTNECNGMTFGNWFAARFHNPTLLLTLSR